VLGLGLPKYRIRTELRATHLSWPNNNPPTKLLTLSTPSRPHHRSPPRPVHHPPSRDAAFLDSPRGRPPLPRPPRHRPPVVLSSTPRAALPIPPLQALSLGPPRAPRPRIWREEAMAVCSPTMAPGTSRRPPSPSVEDEQGRSTLIPIGGLEDAGQTGRGRKRELGRS
jgi:hypothetical protein